MDGLNIEKTLKGGYVPVFFWGAESTIELLTLGVIDVDGNITSANALEVLRYSVGFVGDDSPINKLIVS